MNTSTKNSVDESVDPQVEAILTEILGQSDTVDAATVDKWQEAVIAAATATRRQRRVRYWTFTAMLTVAAGLAVVFLLPSTPRPPAELDPDSPPTRPSSSGAVVLQEEAFPRAVVWDSPTSVQVFYPGWRSRTLVAVGPGGMRAEITVRRVLASQ